MNSRTRYLRDRLLGAPAVLHRIGDGNAGVELMGPRERELIEELEELAADGVTSIDIEWGRAARGASREAKASAVLEHLQRRRVITVVPRETRRIFQFA